MNVYRLNGQHFGRFVGGQLHKANGTHVGRKDSVGRVWSNSGKYLGDLVGDRVVRKTTKVAPVGSPRVPRVGSPGSSSVGRAGRVPTAGEVDGLDGL